MPNQPDVTGLLIDLDAGDRSAFETLVTVLYEDLSRMARGHLRRHGGQVTMPTSGLVHEAFLKLTDQTRLSWENRAHFLGVYARVMRNILIDMARKKKTAKHGGDHFRVTLDESHLQIHAEAEDLIALEEALVELQSVDPRLVKVVECRFFGGLSDQETALVLQVNERTVRRDWVKARTLLHRSLGGKGGAA